MTSKLGKFFVSTLELPVHRDVKTQREKFKCHVICAGKYGGLILLIVLGVGVGHPLKRLIFFLPDGCVIES